MKSAMASGMLRDHYERTRLIGTPRSRKGILVLMATGLVALLAFAIWMSPGGDAGFEQGDGLVRTTTGAEGSVGTTGEQEGNLGGDNSGPALVQIDNPIHEIETITGTNDGHELVGRRVDLHVPIQQHVNDVAFWVGPGDNRVLVVLARDNRDGEMRQRGKPSSSGLGEIRAGQQATVSGTVQKVPYAEAMYSWGLTNADRTELMDRPIYIRADSITPNGS